MTTKNGYTFKIKTFRVTESAKPEDGSVNHSEEAFLRLCTIYEQDESIDLDREHFVVLALNARGRVIGYKVVAAGTSTSCMVSPRDVFRAALALDAIHIIVAHNHPSGDPTPSDLDSEITKVLVDGGDLIGVKVLEHLVIAKNHRRGWTYRAVQA